MFFWLLDKLVSGLIEYQPFWLIAFSPYNIAHISPFIIKDKPIYILILEFYTAYYAA